MNHHAATVSNLPSVDRLLRTETALRLSESLGLKGLTEIARTVIAEMRVDMSDCRLTETNRSDGCSREALLDESARRLQLAATQQAARRMRRVINATGVIVHTNLGRSPLSEMARVKVVQEAAGYCTLEYDLQTGARGRRGARVEDLLVALTGAEEALVVNNCAAAALLTLTALAQGGETIISRGELVEIGGDFRVPEVMAQSGTTMIEIGTTNRTNLNDYERAITDRTRLLLSVHPSNYRVVGFTGAPDLKELTSLAHARGLPVFQDAGSGALLDLRSVELKDEPIIADSVASGADVIAFSGDKLLGGPQAGLVVGRREFVGKLRRHPLYRALRADKLALAALEATLDAYSRGVALSEVPTLRMLSLTYEQIEVRAQAFRDCLLEKDVSRSLQAEIIKGRSAVGGGSAPTVQQRTALIALTHVSLSADAFEKALRACDPPVIGRIAESRLLLDLRTVAEDEEVLLLNSLLGLHVERKN